MKAHFQLIDNLGNAATASIELRPEDMELSPADFCARFIEPAFMHCKNRLNVPPSSPQAPVEVPRPQDEPDEEQPLAAGVLQSAGELIEAAQEELSRLLDANR